MLQIIRNTKHNLRGIVHISMFCSPEYNLWNLVIKCSHIEYTSRQMQCHVFLADHSLWCSHIFRICHFNRLNQFTTDGIFYQFHWRSQIIVVNPHLTGSVKGSLDTELIQNLFCIVVKFVGHAFSLVFCTWYPSTHTKYMSTFWIIYHRWCDFWVNRRNFLNLTHGTSCLIHWIYQ